MKTLKTLAIIPARSGSKGIPGKNVRDFCGKPLLQWAVEIGLETCDWVAVSTESAKYAAVARRLGIDVVHRPDGLASDSAPMLNVVKHALEASELTGWSPDVVVLLQPTAPLRTARHVRVALDSLRFQMEADSVVSVVEIPAHYSPDYALEIASGRLGPFFHHDAMYDCAWSLDDMKTYRQDARKAYSRDGTVYAIRRETIERGSLYGDKCVPLIIPPHESCNIDTEEDWQRAEAMMKARLG